MISLIKRLMTFLFVDFSKWSELIRRFEKCFGRNVFTILINDIGN